MRTSSKIFIADDHPMLRAGLKLLIEDNSELSTCGECGAVDDVVPMVTKTKPDLVILDISLEGGNGLGLIKSLCEIVTDYGTKTQVLVMSAREESLYARRALEHGAMGYLCKKEPLEQAITAIQHVLSGKIYISEQVNTHYLETQYESKEPTMSPAVTKLSNREMEIFTLIGEGMPAGKIADYLSLSVKTVESHRENIKRKLNFSSSNELTRYAMQYIIEQG